MKPAETIKPPKADLKVAFSPAGLEEKSRSYYFNQNDFPNNKCISYLLIISYSCIMQNQEH